MSTAIWQVGNDQFVMMMVLLMLPASCWWLSRAWFARRSNRGLAILIVGLYALFSTFVFPWGIVTIHLRWFPLLAWAAASTISLYRPLRPASRSKNNMRRRRRGLFIFAALMLLLDASMLIGLLPPKERIDLAFPLKNGRYYILQGGSCSWLNYHYGQKPEFCYALDIAQVDHLGRRANGLLSQVLDEYVIYGATVYSPCSGQVVALIDGLEDSPIFTQGTDEPGGNQIAIDCSSVIVWLEHLRKDSISVRVGQVVQEGDPLAQVGNSGTSSEPHLHIHASRITGGEMGECLGITFAGRFLVRNMVFHASED